MWCENKEALSNTQSIKGYRDDTSYPQGEKTTNNMYIDPRCMDALGLYVYMHCTVAIYVYITTWTNFCIDLCWTKKCQKKNLRISWCKHLALPNHHPKRLKSIPILRYKLSQIEWYKNTWKNITTGTKTNTSNHQSVEFLKYLRFLGWSLSSATETLSVCTSCSGTTHQSIDVSGYIREKQ